MTGDPAAPDRTPALAIILARAGSKGLPRKNALLIAGKPCAQWTIEAALAARTVGEVVLSTDDAELLALAARAHIRAVPRPPELASDSATVDAAARHALGVLEANGGESPAARPIVVLYANVPVRPPGLIDRAVNLCRESGCDSVQSYAPVGKNHPWWTVRVAADGRLSPWEGDRLYHGVYRRQDLPPAFIPNGGVLVVTRRALMLEIPAVSPGPSNPHAFLGLNQRGLTNDSGAVVDIDSHLDLLVAQAILSERAAASTC